MLKYTIMFAAIVALVLALAPAAQAALTGQLGILDLTLDPDGAGPLNAGDNPATGLPWALDDQYHLAFVTSTTHNATSTDIAVYNAFVQSVADSAGSLVKTAGAVAWKAMVSAYGPPVVDARTNLGVGGGGGYATFRLDSVMLAPDYDTMIDAVGKVFIDGVYLTVNEAGVDTGDGRVWTGTNHTLMADLGRGPLGDADDTAANGKIVAEGGHWCCDTWATSTSSRMYAMSEALEIVPEPATMALLGIGGLGVLLRRKRR